MNVELDLMADFQVASTIDSFADIVLSKANSTELIIQWSIISVTGDTELAALRHLTETKRIGERKPSEKSVRAFKTIQDFHGTEKAYQSLHDEFPHLADPSNPKYRVKSALLKKFKSFNVDHQAAYEGLANYANGLYFLQGCPGAGKTEFNMVLTALIQSYRRKKPKRRHSPVLFLVDINKTVDDAADRYFQLCREVGLNLRVIRMHGFPYEMRNSERIQGASAKNDNASATTLDFTKKFLATASMASCSGLRPSAMKAPTLDEAAWQYFELHKEADCFVNIAKSLEKMKTPVALSAQDWKSLRGSIATLYKAVLVQADFIATTPVGASGSFSKLFHPEVIIIDEAPHARELTTLIPIAYFDPLLWMFTGDVRQTQPFVKGGSKRDMERHGLKENPYAAQLKLSTMARAAAAGALNAQLLVNKRAHGNLHRLPSAIFYGGHMRSGHEDYMSMYPQSTAYLRGHLARIGGITFALKENRIIVQLEGSAEKMFRSSFWNPYHHEWLLAQAKALLSDPKFESLHKGQPGTIMIETPYKSAFRQYEAAVKQWPEEWRNRVEVLTVDKAQGNQADVVLLDMVRTTTPGFMDNPQRLNVAITRARQAEIIVMDPAMTTRVHRGMSEKTLYTSQLWIDTLLDGRVFLLKTPKETQQPLSPVHPNMGSTSFQPQQISTT